MLPHPKRPARPGRRRIDIVPIAIRYLAIGLCCGQCLLFSERTPAQIPALAPLSSTEMPANSTVSDPADSSPGVGAASPDRGTLRGWFRSWTGQNQGGGDPAYSETGSPGQARPTAYRQPLFGRDTSAEAPEGIPPPSGSPPIDPFPMPGYPNLDPGPTPALTPQSLGPIFRLHQTISEVVGEDADTSVGGFFPHVTDYGLWFIDGQFNTIEDVHNPGEQTLNYTGNFGLGFRRLDVPNNQVLGLSFWYDLDHSRPEFAHQASVGLEVLQDLWSLRSNIYVPIGGNRTTEYLSPLGAPFYLGENIVFPQTRIDNLSMAGIDVEVGRRLPGWLGDNGVSLYGGAYYYQANQEFHTVGAEARLEALISPTLTVDCKFTSDQIFHNNVDVGITWAMTFVRCKSCCNSPDAYYRLTEPVVRNRDVVFANQTVSAPVVATNPATGQPIIVVHVDSNATAPGNGTYAMPYTSLPLAQAGSAPNDIILVDAGSVFNGQGITLQNGQRFLGEGIPHTVDTVQAGTILLPPPTGGTALPIINNSPGNAVTLASNNEVSGFVINNPTGAAIAGTGITGTANINNNQLNGGAYGINIQNQQRQCHRDEHADRRRRHGHQSGEQLWHILRSGNAVDQPVRPSPVSMRRAIAAQSPLER